MQIRADQSEALKPRPLQPIRSSKTATTLSTFIPSYTKPPITSNFSVWSSLVKPLRSNCRLQINTKKGWSTRDVFEARATLALVLVGGENTRAAVASRRWGDGWLAARLARSSRAPLVCVASFTNSVLFLPGDNMLSLRISHPWQCAQVTRTSRLATVIPLIFLSG